ncbi:MAG TPA: isocitrate/isopropylmalate dehydrogenase family protein [Candidatus Ozemobacteraceae bacterium]|nr:isocitrate/isopropylmalate dehydrogenase family protein [Candidatus Ozemobacteraceae bacterium]
MAKYRIAWLPGDGVGVDVMNAARKVLDAVKLDAEYLHGDIGWEFWCKEGNPLPERTVKVLNESDVALFGTITSPSKEEAAKELAPELQGKGLIYSSPIVTMRQSFDLYACVRPCRSFAKNPLNCRENIDITVFRETTEGLYSGIEFCPIPEDVRVVIEKHNTKMTRFNKFPAGEVALSARIMTQTGCERIIRKAFEFAKANNKPSVTLVEKSNMLRETGGLMLRTMKRIATEYPDISWNEANIDALCMWLLKNPERYHVLVAENMFGDIISDLCAQLVGGLGFACSGNIGDRYAIFEPTHGPALKYAGQNKVNPLATILAAMMMIDWLGEKEPARRIHAAVAVVVAEAKARTSDMGGSTTTSDMADAVVEALKRV